MAMFSEDSSEHNSHILYKSENHWLNGSSLFMKRIMHSLFINSDDTQVMKRTQSSKSIYIKLL